MLTAHRFIPSAKRYLTPTFVAVNTAVSPSNSTSIAVTIPSGASVGDLLVLGAVMKGTQAFTTPTGWTLLLDNANSVVNTSGWYRMCQSGDPGSTVTVNIAAGGTEIPSAFCAAYSNVDTTTPVFNVSGPGNVATSTSWDVGHGDNRTQSNPVLAVMIAGRAGVGDINPVTFGTGITGRMDVGGPSGQRLLCMGDDIVPAATLQGSRIITPQAPGDEWEGVSALFNAAAA